LLAIWCLAPPAHAHLSILRQGAETAGANEAGDQLGFAVAAGDFNGDHFDDLAMGAPQEDLSSVANAGVIFVNWGSSYGTTHVGRVYHSAADMTGSIVAGANLGWSLAAADLNRDGFDDLVVGAPFETIGSVANAGSVYVMRGTSIGLQPWMSFTQAHFGASIETGDKFGFSLAIGHFNDDADPDLVIGSPGENGSTGVALYVMGTDVGLFGAKGILDLADAGQVPRAGDQLGTSLTTGNLMAGPEDEIVCGVPFRGTDGGQQQFGAIMLTPGSASGPVQASSRYYTAPGGTDASAKFGTSLASGRLMNGSYEALAVGEPFRDVHPFPEAGRVVVIPGGFAGLATGSTVEVYESNAGGAIGEGDGFGQAIAVDYYWSSADGWQDLAVGSPGEGYGTGDSYGQVQILNGGPSGPIGIYGWSGFNQGTLNEKLEPADVLGHALTFGHFDGSGFGNLAASAPGEDAFAGLVHVIAPWRQVFNLSCERSIVLDCNDEIYFSQKPFDRVLIASTTKIMTVLLACEHAARHDPDLDDVYTVPAWVADDIPGSQVPLYEGEWITFEDLMYTCLLRSGNDAAHAIADMIHGSNGPDESLPIFVNEMNAKAGLIGMTGTHFNNPAGFEQEKVGPDKGEHYSTPRDMAILSSYAMQNALFRQIAGSTEWELVRHFPEYDIFWNCKNIFRSVLWNNIEPLTGIKGGETAAAGVTGCFSGASPAGNRTIAGSYTTPAPAENYGPDAGALVQLGLAACGYYFTLGEEWGIDTPFSTHGIRSRQGDRHGASAAIPGEWDGTMEFSVHRTAWETGESSSLTMQLTHLVELRGPGVHDIGAWHIAGHGPVSITNVGEQLAVFEVRFPYGTEVVDLGPGETTVLPESSQGRLGFPVQFAGHGGASIDLDVEIPYLHNVTSPADPTTDPVYVTRILRGATIAQDGIEIRTLGLDAESSTYSVFGHAVGDVVSTPEDGAGPGPAAAPLRARAPQPNPFGTSTRIGFDLVRPGVVGVEIHDVTGRLVRSYDPMSMSVGGWGVQWDGRTNSGTAAPSGAYTYRVTLDGKTAATGKLTRLR
jgi:hypothetical protein